MTIKAIVRGVASAAGLLVLGSAAMAADLPSRKYAAPEPIAIDTFHPFQIRLRATAVVPDGNATVYDRYGAILPLVSMSGGPGSPIFGSGGSVNTTVIPEVDLSYYFTKNIAVEAVCCFSKHKVTGTGALDGLNIGNTWVFPPTVLLQYHFTNFGAFQPYVGIGVNFTAFFSAKGGNQYTPFITPAGLVGANAVTDLRVGSSWGVAGQVGFDYMINSNWGINFDVKRILMQPTAYATVWNSAVSSTLGPIPVRAKVNIDPWLVSAGITYRFGGGSSGPVLAKY
ncbi:MAG: OmpW/AlkL family protein [Rhodoblastus sp.]